MRGFWTRLLCRALGHRYAHDGEEHDWCERCGMQFWPYPTLPEGWE